MRSARLTCVCKVDVAWGVGSEGNVFIMFSTHMVFAHITTRNTFNDKEKISGHIKVSNLINIKVSLVINKAIVLIIMQLLFHHLLVVHTAV